MNVITNKTNCVLAAIIITATISGCQSNGAEDSTSHLASSGIALPPADKPGTIIHALRNGKPVTYSVTAIDGDTYTGEDSNGCSYTELSLV